MGHKILVELEDERIEAGLRELAAKFDMSLPRIASNIVNEFVRERLENRERLPGVIR